MGVVVFREVFQYPTGSDSTLGAQPVKREHSPDGDERGSSKKIKLDDGANDVSLCHY